jgi:hypothetical protein
VRVFVTDAAHDRKRAARARAAISGRRFEGSHRESDYFTGPTRQGVLLQSARCVELADLLVAAAALAEINDDT